MSKSKDLYLLVDGTYASPDDCDVGADNELRHNDNGVPVALGADGKPQTIFQGAVDNKNKEAAEAGEEAAKEAEQIAKDAEEAAKADAKPPKGPLTDINPATGKSSDEDLLLTTDDVKPKVAKPKAKKADYKNRELKAR